MTGAAGFIGFHVAEQLLSQGHEVVGLDNINDYYDISLKLDRLKEIEANSNFTFKKMDLADRDGMANLFAGDEFDVVIHLAAQAGVRYSIENPYAYIDSNIVGHMAILEGVRKSTSVKHLVYASSSSVYGLNQAMPFSTADNVDHPVSLYAATKKSNELMSHTYSHLYGIPTTGLRFFTVYGPWGRPDMAPIKFAKAISEGKAIDIYNHGDMSRDFTYIDDIVNGIIAVSAHPPEKNPDWDPNNKDIASSSAPYRVFNIGNGTPVSLMDFISAIENELGVEAEKNFLPMQPGDVHRTWASTKELTEATGYSPDVGVEKGVKQFIEWFKKYYL